MSVNGDKKAAIKCRWCRSTLADKAGFCHRCQRSQKRAIEYLRYWTPIVGLLAVFFSGLSYIYPDISAWARSYFEPSIEMKYFATETTDSIISNVGNSDVFLTTLWVTPVASKLQGHRIHYPINKLLRHGTVLALDLESARTKFAKANPDIGPFQVLPIVPRNAIGSLEKLLKENNLNVTTAIFDESNAIFKIAEEMLDTVVMSKHQRNRHLMEMRGVIYSLRYECELEFVHRYSEKFSPYVFPCKGIYATRGDLAKLLGASERGNRGDVK